MKKPFKVLATSGLLLMLAACNTNNNAAYDALNPGDNNNPTRVTHRGDNLGDAFRLRNGQDTAEEINTKRTSYRGGTSRDIDTTIRGNNVNNFNYQNDNRNGFNTAFNRDNDNGFLDGNAGTRDFSFNRAGNRIRNDFRQAKNNIEDTISADYTTMNSGQFPHTKAVTIQDAKYGYVVMSPQGQQITTPDLQSVTEEYAKRFQTQLAQQYGNRNNIQPFGNQQQAARQGQQWNQMQPQMGQGGQQQTTQQKQQQTVQRPAAQAQPKQQTQTTQPKSQATTPAKTTQTTQGISAYEQKVIDLTNAERRKAGVRDLVGDAKLSSVARTKSNDMQKNSYFSHTSPTYGSPFDMMRDFGVTYSTAGENIAQGQRTPEEVVKAWMNSEGHRRNILNGSFTHIGVGYESTGSHWTQMFIGK
ncbi:CAP domain-containing protein [Pseudoneobacillus sp. C159]